MIELKSQYPFVDGKGNVKDNLIIHYAEDENGVKYYIIQNETGIKYESAVDVYPCRHTYSTTDEIVPTREERLAKIKQNQ